MDVQNEYALAAFKRTLVSRKRSPRTIQSYEEAIDQLDSWVDGQDLMTLEQGDIEDYIGDLLAWATTTTAAIRYRSLRAFYNWAVVNERIDTSPMRKMQEPKVEDRGPAIVEDDDLRALFATCAGKEFENVRDLAILRLFCEPGTPRLAEMASITLTNLDMRYNRVSFLGKGDKWRTIPFGNKTGRALDKYLPARGRHEFAEIPELWIGTFRRGRLTASGIAQMLRKRCRRAGIAHIHPHQLRHTSKHNWDLSGGSEADAELLFGWTPGSGMARRYGRSANVSRAEKAARKLSPADRL